MKTKWLKDGQPFLVKDKESRILALGKAIFIKNARFSDSGLFTCVVSNAAGQITSNAKLRVLGEKVPGNAINFSF